MQRKLRVAGGSLVVVALFFSVVYWLPALGVGRWSPINCWHYDVGIYSGRVRYTRCLLYAQVKERIDDTAVSLALGQEDLAGFQPDWRRIMTLSPGVGHSPHHLFHAAIGQVRQLEMAWRVGNFTPEAQRLSAIRLLELWQEGQADNAAGAYLYAIGDLASESDSAPRTTEAGDVAGIR